MQLEELGAPAGCKCSTLASLHSFTAQCRAEQSPPQPRAPNTWHVQGSATHPSFLQGCGIHGRLLRQHHDNRASCSHHLVSVAHGSARQTIPAEIFHACSLLQVMGFLFFFFFLLRGFASEAWSPQMWLSGWKGYFKRRKPPV